MRGWVGVQNEKRQKNVASPFIQDFEGNVTFKPSAHLMELCFSDLHFVLRIAIYQNPY